MKAAPTATAAFRSPSAPATTAATPRTAAMITAVPGTSTISHGSPSAAVKTMLSSEAAPRVRTA
ncbi:hypothetical protein [Actinomadura madurae]|uniref:hypothetical protein n=1 Tax=Actinomadura madurae TaxID=1993 RepID=UPI0020D23D9B|nr:hypothetical protein [Actinomadura madurae]MCQ0006559.1 hypothetical protein [Actinomadura madurae]